MTLFLTCSPACQTTRKPQQADNPFLRDSSYLLRHQTGNSLLFDIFVHHFQSPITICGQMPFLGLHPRLFIPHRSWRPTVPLLLPAWNRKSALPNCCWLSLGHQGTARLGGWQGRACGILTDEEISQITSPAVNSNDSQQWGIAETDPSSFQLQWPWWGLMPGPMGHLCLGEEVWILKI